MEEMEWKVISMLNKYSTNIFVKLRERERHRVDQGKKEKKWMVDGGYPFPDALH